jgi:sugar/nucleoside kinase (ribokinase family)
MAEYDLVFVGHIGYDELFPFNLEKQLLIPSGAVLYGLHVAKQIASGKVAVVTKISEKDVSCLDCLKSDKIDFFPVPTAQTHYLKVVYPTANPEDRRIILEKGAGEFKPSDFPNLNAKIIYLSANTDKEFKLDFIHSLKAKGHHICMDLQSFVRHVGEGGRVAFADFVQKKDVVKLLDKVKLDCVEAKLLTGTEDWAKAAEIVSSWGCPEVVITSGTGVLVRANGKSFFGRFTNKNNSGRNGRGDTVFTAYVLWRTNHSVEDSVRFAAALASIKLESANPFCASVEDVFARIEKDSMETEVELEGIPKSSSKENEKK